MYNLHELLIICHKWTGKIGAAWRHSPSSRRSAASRAPQRGWVMAWSCWSWCGRGGDRAVERQQLEFLRRVVAGDDAPNGPRVRIFVMGHNVWRDEEGVAARSHQIHAVVSARRRDAVTRKASIHRATVNIHLRSARPYADRRWADADERRIGRWPGVAARTT